MNIYIAPVRGPEAHPIQVSAVGLLINKHSLQGFAKQGKRKAKELKTEFQMKWLQLDGHT